METTRELATGMAILERDASPAERARPGAKRPGKAEKIVYFVSTGLLVLLMAPGGVGNFLRTSEALAVFQHLGYPDYFSTMLGAAKLLGVFAVLAPLPHVLREWAYAGFAFDVIAAGISITVIDGLQITGVAVPLVGLAIILTSYRGWKLRARAADAAP